MRDYITTLVFINHEVNPERLHHSPNFGFIKNKLVQMNPYYFITNSHCQSSLQIYVRCHFQKFSDSGIAKDCILLPACDFVCHWPIKILDFLFTRMVIIGLGRKFFLFTKKPNETRGTVFKLAALPVNNLSRMPYCEIISFPSKTFISKILQGVSQKIFKLQERVRLSISCLRNKTT